MAARPASIAYDLYTHTFLMEIYQVRVSLELFIEEIVWYLCALDTELSAKNTHHLYTVQPTRPFKTIPNFLRKL